MRSKSFILAALPVAMFASACSSETGSDSDNGASGGDNVEVRIAPTSPSAIAMAPTWVALAKGFYEEEGLDVEIIGNVAGGTVEDALATEDLDIGGSAHTNLWPRVETLAEQDIEMVTFLPDSPYAWRLMVLENSPFTDHKDLVGETIGITEAGGDEVATELLMRLGGVEAGEFETLITGGRAAGGVALENGDVASFMGSYVDRAAIDAVTPVRLMETGEEDNLFMGGWTARKDWLAENSDIAVGFGRAWAKGAIWAMENPEATVDLIAEVNPESVTDRDQALELLKIANEFNRPLYDRQYQQSAEEVQATLELTQEMGLVPSSVQVEDVYTEEYLDQIWDFDVDAVIEEARGAA